jgi:putative tryptophan/tyrosine transport system substrate-binding protein
MRRRTFIAGLGSAAAWPLAARGQQGERMRRVGVLMGFEESNLEAKAFLSAFTQGLDELGWTDGRNVRMTFAGPPVALTGRGCSRKNWSICNPT